jgi:CRP/FNR family transcriptional regulator, dissimilatory nitrate respiration regulator
MNAAAHRKLTRDPRLIEGVLANLPLMEGVARQVVRQLAIQSVLMNVRRGEVVIRRGQLVRGVHAIAYGSVKKRLRHRGGAEVVLALLGPGDCFAEVPAMLGSPARVEAVALADSMLVIVNAECISTQTVSEPRLARNLNRNMARRMHALLGEFERGLLPGPQRLAGYLDTIAEATQEAGRWVARLPVSKTLLAARLDMTKETLSRLLRRLAADGLIDVSRREIVILDRSGLVALSAE